MNERDMKNSETTDDLVQGAFVKAIEKAHGLIPLITGLVGSCPIYSVLGISTCKNCDVEKAN